MTISCTVLVESWPIINIKLSITLKSQIVQQKHEALTIPARDSKMLAEPEAVKRLVRISLPSVFTNKNVISMISYKDYSDIWVNIVFVFLFDIASVFDAKFVLNR